MIVNPHNPEGYTVYGEAVITSGLTVQHGVDGVGLVTRGFVWTGYAIWLDIQAAAPAIVTSWTDSNSVITTTWTPTIYGQAGEFES